MFQIMASIPISVFPKVLSSSLDAISAKFLEGNTTDIFNFSTCLYTVVALILLYLYWYLFIRTFDLYRDFSSLGFEDEKDVKRNNASRRHLINELRQRRKVGDIPPSYPNGWFGIIESDQLKQGTAVEINALGQNLVGWRGESGQAYVADAYCPHIGAHLGVGGKVHGECIECPFHSWRFDGQMDGKLKSIPYSPTVPEFAKLKMWTISEANGFIFLWYHAENEEPSWYPEVIDEIETGIWKYRGRSEFRVSCHIQEIPENGADIAHLNVLHKSSTLCGDNPDKAWLSWSFMQHVWSAKWMPNPDSGKGHQSLLTVEHYINLFNRFSCLHINVDIHQIGPGIVVLNFDTVLGKATFIQTVTPIEPLLQRITHRFYSCSTYIHPLGLITLSAEAEQLSRDIRIWNRKCFISKPILTKEDQTIKSYRRWFSQFYTENSPRHYFGSTDANANKLAF